MNYHARLEAPDEECPHCQSAAWHVWGGRAKYQGRMLDVPKDVDYFVCKTCSEEFFSTEQVVRFNRAMQALLEGHLTCPACEEPCTTIPPAEYRFVCLGKTVPTWNEDQEGTCECGARVYVFITGDEDGEYAELRERDDE